MKTIGVVCEGNRDYDMIKRTIRSFCHEDLQFLFLQPSDQFGMDNGGGWKGVVRWCREHADDLYDYLNVTTPIVDLLVVHMDADVARCEKEIYCSLADVSCDGVDREDPLNCAIARDKNCPQVLPPNSVCDGTPEQRIVLLEEYLKKYLNTDERVRYIVTIPCDATDAWIIAAFGDEVSDMERLDNPWGYISRKKYYHGIRTTGHKKHKRTYDPMITKVCENWERVKETCPQALRFETGIMTKLMTSAPDEPDLTGSTE